MFISPDFIFLPRIDRISLVVWNSGTDYGPLPRLFAERPGQLRAGRSRLHTMRVSEMLIALELHQTPNVWIVNHVNFCIFSSYVFYLP